MRRRSSKTAKEQRRLTRRARVSLSLSHMRFLHHYFRAEQARILKNQHRQFSHKLQISVGDQHSNLCSSKTLSSKKRRKKKKKHEKKGDYALPNILSLSGSRPVISQSTHTSGPSANRSGAPCLATPDIDILQVMSWRFLVH